MTESAVNWRCPHCEAHSVIDEHRQAVSFISTTPQMKAVEGPNGIAVYLTVCPNPKCRKTTVDIAHHKSVVYGGEWCPDSQLAKWRIRPWGVSKHFEDYVPAAIRQDYEEACSIKDLSPKAAATLARRAVQGIIRDYWGITKGRLVDEIKELRTKAGTQDVTQEIVDNIDALREVGNIGAHMEKDVNVIVDVEPDEAELLIHLVESLIEDTYVARHARQERSKKMMAMQAAKKAAKSPPVASPAVVNRDET